MKNFKQIQQCSLSSLWLLFSWEIFENWELFCQILSVVCVIIRHISDDGLFLLVELETSSMDYAWNRWRRRRLDSYKFIDNEKKLWLFPVLKLSLKIHIGNITTFSQVVSKCRAYEISSPIKWINAQDNFSAFNFLFWFSMKHTQSVNFLFTVFFANAKSIRTLGNQLRLNYDIRLMSIR